MNILFDCNTFDAGPQGTTTFLAGLLNALPDAMPPHHALDITCAARNRASVDRFIDVPFHFAPITGGFAVRNLHDLPRLTRTLGTDLVVSQYVRPFRSRSPTVSVIHDVLFLDFPALFGWRYRMIRRVMFGWAARHSDVVATVSNYSRQRIAHHFGLPLERIDVLPNAVDVTTPLPTPDVERQPGPLRLLYISRFETRKRQEWCVHAANALARRGQPVTLTLVGNDTGPHAETVRTAIASDPVADAQVTIRSNISHADLDALLAEADLFLFPSECEGFGIPVIEAAAHGIPGVVAANTAMAELGRHYAGIAVHRNGCDAFAEAVIEAVARLPALRQEAIALAPATRAAYRWADVAREFVTILERRGVMV